MNILNVTTNIDLETGGGSAERTYQMSRHLAKKGHSCTILSYKFGLNPLKIKKIEECGISLKLLSGLSDRFFIPFFNPYTLNNLIKKQDVIHLMNNWSILNVLIFLFARFNHKPFVFCPAGSLYIYGRSKNLKRLFNFLVGRRIAMHANYSIACAKNELHFFYECGVDKNKIKIIPNGINLDEYNPKKTVSLNNYFSFTKKPFILFVGRLNKIKGPDILLKAYVNVASSLNLNLVFLGRDEGALFELRKIVQEKKLEKKVFFLGHVSGNLKASFYHGCKFVVIPSHSEPLPIVLLEAGASRKPVMITNKCGFNEIEKINGGLVVKPNILSIRKGLIAMVKKLKTEKEMGNNLFDYISRHYSWDKIINSYIMIYKSLVK